MALILNNFHGIPVEIIRSSRRTLSVSVKADGHLLVRAPRRMPEMQIRLFLEEKKDWILKRAQKAQERSRYLEDHPENVLSDADIQKLADQAMQVIPAKVRHYAPLVGVTYGRITIRNQKTRWGSCSSKGNLNFNCLLMLAPEEVQDYVVVHELCHRKEMNHSARFWKEVEKVLPDYKKRVRWLKENGDLLMARMTGLE